MTDERKLLADRLEALVKKAPLMPWSRDNIRVSGEDPYEEMYDANGLKLFDTMNATESACIEMEHDEDRFYRWDSGAQKTTLFLENLTTLLPDILAALRQPSTDDAFRRGAEAMREADVTRCLSTALTFRQMGVENTARAFELQAEMIRLAPLPEPKP